jgi:Rad3-related DNA helicase
VPLLYNFKVISGKLRPADLGLPAQFREFREAQLIALDKFLSTDKKYQILDAPCGLGKSLLMAACGRGLGMIKKKKTAGERTIYSCHEKNLQAQVTSDFSHDLDGCTYAVELRGRVNYVCLKNRSLSCNECSKDMNNTSSCARCEYHECSARNTNADAPVIDQCPCVHKCAYRTAKEMAAKAEMAILNVPYYLAEANTPGSRFTGWPLAILDEADRTEQALMAHIGITIPDYIIRKLNLPLPPLINPIRQNETDEWLSQFVPAIKLRLGQIYNNTDPGAAAIREKKQLERLADQLIEFRDEEWDEWVVISPEETRDQPAVTWKPVRIKKQAAKYLWRHAERFLLMSGSILSSTHLAEDLGLDRAQVEYISIDASFPPETRPIFYIPVADMSAKNLNNNGERALGLMVKKTDEIISCHPNDKGIIHTSSYFFAKYFTEHSRHLDRLITHANAAEREDRIKIFMESPQALVMVSPSMERGFDGKDDLCRFIIVVKIPYPNPTDPQIARRLLESGGKVWYDHNVLRAIIQETSRGNRHERDYCEIYILDSSFGRLFYGTIDQNGRKHSGYSGIFPKYWKQSLHKVEVMSETGAK